MSELEADEPAATAAVRCVFAPTAASAAGVFAPPAAGWPGKPSSDVLDPASAEAPDVPEFARRSKYLAAFRTSHPPWHFPN